MNIENSGCEFHLSPLTLYSTGGYYGHGASLVGKKVMQKNVQMYKLCTLAKLTEEGYPAFFISWIRSDIAILGAIIDNLKCTETGRIKNGWTVHSVGEGYDCERPEWILIPKSHDYDKLSTECDL